VRESAGWRSQRSSLSQVDRARLPETTMSNGPRLPAELLDDVVDLLHDAQHALEGCCLVSKSWIPRTRKHLFASVKFSTAKSLESWKNTFPDPSTSPARYTKTLSISCFYAVTVADVQAGGWIRTFSRVSHLTVHHLYGGGFAAPPPLRFFDFILSLPLLENLNASIREDLANDDEGSEGSSPPVQSSSPPRFTGSLELSYPGTKHISRRLLSLPGGIHFRKLILKWSKAEDLSLTMALVEGCSHALESLDITHVSRCTSICV